MVVSEVVQDFQCRLSKSGFMRPTTHRNPMLPVDESGVLELLAPTRYRLQYDSWQR